MSSSPVRRSKFNTVDVSQVHSNVGQEVIEITSDKLQLILNQYIESMSSRKEWQNPLTLFVTIVLVLCTTDFKLTWNISPDTWSSIFIISAVLSLIWFVKSVINMKKAITVEDILNAAKNKT